MKTMFHIFAGGRALGLAVAIAAAASLGATAARAEGAAYRLDPEHSTIGFLVDHIGFARVMGKFTDVSGEFTFDEKAPALSGLRVVVRTVPECYAALGVIHSRYPLVPGRFKDYISTPKQNGYRSLHSGVIGPEQQRIEIQIRTAEMHDVAELGVAAHWSYKDGRPATAEGKSYRWLRELLEILEHESSP